MTTRQYAADGYPMRSYLNSKKVGVEAMMFPIRVTMVKLEVVEPRAVPFEWLTLGLGAGELVAMTSLGFGC